MLCAFIAIVVFFFKKYEITVQHGAAAAVAFLLHAFLSTPIDKLSLALGVVNGLLVVLIIRKYTKGGGA